MFMGRIHSLFEWLKKLFSRKGEQTTQAPEAPKLQTNPCKTCGKPISYDPSWTHIPNYCPECKAKYRAEHGEQRPRQKMIKRTCRSCGREFTFPSTVQHWPNYCRDCRAKFKEQRA